MSQDPSSELRKSKTGLLSGGTEAFIETFVVARYRGTKVKVKLIGANTEIMLNDLPVMIGRNHAADICLDDAGMGEFQCIIEQDDGRPSVVDIAGGLGTFVNGHRIRRAALMPGDRLGVGRRHFTVRYELP